MDKPVLPFPLYKRLFIFSVFLIILAVMGAVWGASPEQRRRMGKRFARFFGF